ncbi:DUF1304 domain-containing protein [Nocardioides sp.]|uniref:DUF1304 domain-containing protein n=1 Tax=Nocardioides sp. TaxID=35761 RepID=UPI00273469DD|nr:DUF1304 domain-containing protein [Nocardioides sp.]MDP3891685.1 DUF1304 domain-containing protein [Nocardioides sp.]
MNLLAQLLVGLVALLHAGFLVLEMFLWATPTGRRVFGLDADFAGRTRALAANQGLYNGFLAAGLVWSLVADRSDVAVFFLGCVVVAGIFGAATVSRMILVVQALPAAVALTVVLLG